MLMMSIGQKHNAIKKSTEALVIANKEISLEVNADKTKYIVMTRDQNAGRSCNKKIDNSSVMTRDQNAGRSCNKKIDNSSFEKEIFGNNPNEPKFCSGRN
jgi:hypothetical protein